MKLPKGLFNKLAAPIILTGALMASPAMAMDGSYTVKACTPEGKTAKVEMLVGESHGSREAVQTSLDVAFGKAVLRMASDVNMALIRAAPLPLDKIESFRADAEREGGAEFYNALSSNAKEIKNAIAQTENKLSITIYDAQIFSLTPGCALK